MQSTHIWRKFYIHRIKVVAVIILMISAFSGYGQKTRWVKRNNPNYDDKKLTYGFLIGIHSSSYQIKYSEKFVTGLDTLHSVTPNWSGGFSLGFIVNYKLADFLDLRLTPKVGFYENRIQYRY